MPQFDARSVRQVDVENDAGRSIEIGVAFKSLRGRKQDGFVGVMPEQPLYCSQHSGVIIDDQKSARAWFHAVLNGLPVALRPDADPLGNRHKLRQGFDLHLLNHVVAMGLHGT